VGALSKRDRHVRRSWLKTAPTIALVALLAACLLPVSARAEATPEYKLKAAYLFNFARFAKWPTNAFATADSPLVIGVLGDNPFDGELEKLVAGRPVGGRAVVVKQVANFEDAKACQVVFIPASEQANLQRHLETLRGAPVLTIGESPELLDAGGVIRFLIEEKKIRFEINKGQADGAGLQLDSQLLNLAKTVRDDAGKKGN
jgi:hypothetical protein